MKYFIRKLIYLIFKFIDFNFWLLIQILPGKVILKLIQKRPIKRFQIRLNEKRKLFCKKIIIKILNKKSSLNQNMSTCLSRSITGQCFLDLLAIPNVICFGAEKTKLGEINCHCWLNDPNKNINLSPASENYFN